METIETFSPEETYMLGKKIGEAACPNTVYALNGDLEAGLFRERNGLGNRRREMHRSYEIDVICPLLLKIKVSAGKA